MILVENKFDVQRSGNFQEKQFSIKATAKSFKILSDGLYSNKVQSIIRESSTNAYDSHIEAGKKDVPFEVHLPNSFENWFSVKDSGVGLSPEDVETIYTSYFTSTKTNSDETVGALGLGSKVFFCYTDNFTVISTYNGERYTYTSFISENGFPSIALLNTEDTDDCNGLEVSFAVHPQDFSKFLKEAKLVYQHFKVKPKIVGQTIIFDEVKPLFSGPGWSVYNSNCNIDNRVVMGCVSYPLSTSSIGMNNHFFSYYVINIDVPIGHVDMTASRESLEYTDKTIKAVNIAYNNMILVFKDNIEKELDNQLTYWDACKFFRKNNLFIGHGKTWQGKTVRELINVPKTDYSKYKNSYNGNIKCQKNVYLVSLQPNDDYYIVEKDLIRGADARVRQLLHNNPNKAVYLVSFNDDQARQAFKDALGTIPAGIYIKASDLPKCPTVPKTSSGVTPNKFIYLINNSNKKSSCWKEKDVDLAAGGIYVEMDNWSVENLDNGKINFRLECLKKLGFNITLNGFRKKVADKIRSNKNWITLHDYITSSIMQFSAEHDFAENINNYSSYDNILYLASKFTTKDLTNFLKRVQYVKSNYDRLNALRNLMSVSMYDYKSTTDIDKEMDDFSKKYPLIFFMIFNHCNFNNIPTGSVEKYIELIDSNTK